MKKCIALRYFLLKYMKYTIYDQPSSSVGYSLCFDSIVQIKIDLQQLIDDRDILNHQSKFYFHI